MSRYCIHNVVESMPCAECDAMPQNQPDSRDAEIARLSKLCNQSPTTPRCGGTLGAPNVMPPGGHEGTTRYFCPGCEDCSVEVVTNG